MKNRLVMKGLVLGIIILFVGAIFLPITCCLNSRGYSINIIKGLIPYKLINQDIIFNDDFDDGDVSDWTVTTSGTGIFDVSSDKYVSPPYSLHMKSIGNSKAMGESPTYDLNLSKDYNVSFNFLIPNTDNHWFEVFNNNQTYVLIDHNTDLKYYDGQNAGLIMNLTTNQWYLIELKIYPTLNSYDVYVDNQFKLTCPFWFHSGFENNFRIGDRAEGSTDKGEAYWDNFMVIQNQSVPNNPPNVPIITGPINGKIWVWYEYNFSLSDPDGDSMDLRVDWGIGGPGKLHGPFTSGTIVTLKYSWCRRGTYTIRAKAFDIYGAESDWGTLTVTMPRYKVTYNSLFLWFLERFPLLERLLNLCFAE